MKILFRTFLLLALIFAFASFLPPDDGWSDKIAPTLLKRLERGETVDCLVLFSAQADLDRADRFRSKAEKGRYVLQQLQQTAATSQQRIRQRLEARAVPFQSFFIINVMRVKGDLDALRYLAEQPEVAAIQPNPQVRLEAPAPVRPDPEAVTSRDGVEWGVARIQADAVWAMGYTGQEVVIGGQDTGYEWEHPTLKATYRGWNGVTADHNYNWHDAIHEISPLHGDTINDPSLNPCGLDSPVPCDDHNHGTHTMGTMVGDDGAGNQIGVAPGASWIACRNMERGWGSPASYIECFEWFLAPTDLNDENPDPAKAPHVINNSWSCPEIEGCNPSNWATMEAVVNNLKAAGIVVVVSAGNNGSSCGTVDRPAAMFENSFAVGATGQNDTIANFSSRGPVTVDGSGILKPNVSAPGVSVRSAVRGGGYANFSGTSMAGPHVAGLVALLISANPALAGQVELIEQIIEETAKPMLSAQDCEGISGMGIPNAVYGYGRVDALAAVNRALEITSTPPASAPVFSVQVTPNPFREAFRLNGRTPAGTLILEMTDARGRTVAREQWRTDGRAIDREVNLPGLPSGLYFYRIAVAGQTLSGRLVRQ